MVFRNDRFVLEPLVVIGFDLILEIPSERNDAVSVGGVPIEVAAHGWRLALGGTGSFDENIKEGAFLLLKFGYRLWRSACLLVCGRNYLRPTGLSVSSAGPKSDPFSPPTPARRMNQGCLPMHLTP